MRTWNTHISSALELVQSMERSSPELEITWWALMAGPIWATSHSGPHPFSQHPFFQVRKWRHAEVSHHASGQTHGVNYRGAAWPDLPHYL